ncbi:MAG TPA: DUF4922 domain-containing protein, partial [Syntrophorhabdaceae bacterium]|nr:DUF4922 domain-containing protein [Syntrophorhabdaceae bacterium]
SSMVHRPQRIKDGIGTIFDLSRDLGDHWVLLYNGHRCGASNPHHLHFQAVPKGNLPVEQEITNKKYLKRIASKDNTHLYTSKGLGRTILIIKGRDKKPIKDMFERIFIILREKGPDEDEPMMNMLSFSSDDDLCLAIFPRSKHRPSIFYKKDDPILISPGAFEMAGVIIVARERDFYRVDKNLVEKVYNEVSLNDLSLENIALF